MCAKATYEISDGVVLQHDRYSMATACYLCNLRKGVSQQVFVTGTVPLFM